MDEIYERRSLPNPTYTQSIHTYRHAYIYIHYITFHYTALRYITSQYITVHCSTLHRILDTFILTYCIEIWFTFTWTACAFQHCIVQRYWCNSLSHVICIYQCSCICAIRLGYRISPGWQFLPLFQVWNIYSIGNMRSKTVLKRTGKVTLACFFPRLKAQPNHLPLHVWASRAARFRFWRDLKPPFQVVQATKRGSPCFTSCEADFSWS